MRRRSVLAAARAGAAALLVGGTRAEAATLSSTASAQAAASSGDAPWAAASLRDLADKIGFRIGSALTPQDIETALYAAIAGGQFSTVTPANGMKWQVVEPTQGTYDWSQADELVNFAHKNNQLVSLGLEIAITEADVRTFVNNATDQVPTGNLALFAHPYEYSEMLKAALAVPECISFTVWGFTDSDSWVPGFFTGEGYADIYDVNQKPKAAYYALQSDLTLAAYGAPHRVKTYTPRS